MHISFSQYSSPESIANNQRICITSDTSQLSTIRRYIEQKALETGLPEQDVNFIVLAVDEACSNLIRHAYHYDGTKQICVDAKMQNHSLVIQIYDIGSEFDPLEIPTVDMDDYFKHYKHGGLGIHIIRKVMDAIEYFPKHEGQPWNILQLVKILH